MAMRPDYEDSEELRRAARLLSQRGASRGGRARWEKICSQERSDYGRKMALARWRKYRSNQSNKGDGVKNAE